MQAAIGDRGHVIPCVAADGGSCRRASKQHQYMFCGIPGFDLLGRSWIELIAMDDLTVVAEAAAKSKREGRKQGQFYGVRQKVVSAPHSPRLHSTRLRLSAGLGCGRILPRR